MKKLIEKSIGAYFNSLALVSPKTAAKKGFDLFCNPMSKALKPYQTTFLETGKAAVLDYEGIKIQTYKWGNGSKKVLLIHGWASHSFRWKAHIEYLIKNDFTVHAFDAPAHGLSSGKMLHLILYSEVIGFFIEKHRGIEHVITHSMGGFAIVYWLFQNKENNLKKVVLMGAPGEATDFFNYYKRTLGLTDRTLKILTDEFAKLLGYGPSYFSASAFVKELRTQGLIIHDKEDKESSYENSVKLNKHWKNSELILTQGLGHSLKSKELLEDIVQFMLEK